MKFSIKDIVNLDEAISYREGEYNPYGMHGFILHDHGFVVCVVWASNLQDALDEAVDANKLDFLKIEEKDFAEYGVWTDEDRSSHLGNAGEAFDIDNLGVEEISNKDFSAQLLAFEVQQTNI